MLGLTTMRRLRAAEGLTNIARQRAESDTPDAEEQLNAASHGPADLWARAVAGLNRLVDAGVVFHAPAYVISDASGTKHIVWDSQTGRWRLIHDGGPQSNASGTGPRQGYSQALPSWMRTP